jgi:DNA-binding NtrC family response regulator
MPSVCRILLIEADSDLSGELITALENEGYKPQAAKTCTQAAALLRSWRSDAIVSEVHLPDGDVERIYRDALPFLGSTPTIFTTASADVDQAVRLVKNGAGRLSAKTLRHLSANCSLAANYERAPFAEA